MNNHYSIDFGNLVKLPLVPKIIALVNVDSAARCLHRFTVHVADVRFSHSTNRAADFGVSAEVSYQLISRSLCYTEYKSTRH